MVAIGRTVRNRLRKARQVGTLVATPGLYPRCLVAATYWWDLVPNFGDQLTRSVLPHFGIAPVHVGQDHATLVGVGSVLNHLPPGWDGIVWGSGVMHADQLPQIAQARVLAVRGRLTQEVLGLEGVSLGDPGLLLPRYGPAARPSGRVAVVPHFTHKQNAWVARLARDPRAQVVDVAWSVSRVARAISSSTAVLTTSLHGLILADAYGVPAVWGLPDTGLSGGDFKHRDYHSAIRENAARRRVDVEGIGIDGILRAADRVDAAEVKRVQDDLVTAGQELRTLVLTRRVPVSLLGDVLRPVPRYARRP